MKQITVEVKNVYGNELIYPMQYQKELQVLTGCKTLTRSHLQALKVLGFTFTQKQIELV